MRLRPVTYFSILLAFLAGCSSMLELSRSKGPFRNVTEAGITADAPEGKLKPVYEKKIRGSVASPILISDKYIAFNTTRERFLILDRENGSRSARIRRGKGLMLKPAIFDSLAVIVKRSPMGQVQVINLFNGRIISERYINDIRSGPITVGEALIFGTTAGVLSLAMPDLKTNWLEQTDARVDLEPAGNRDHLYYVTDGKRLICAQTDDGKTIWSVELESDVVSEISADRFLYLGLADGTLAVIDADKGHYVWKQAVDKPVRGRITRADDRIYLGCGDGKVYCFKSENGVKVWEYQTEGIITATPVVHGRAVLIGSHDKHLYSLDSKTGQLLDRHRLRGPITHAVAIDGKDVFAACGENRIYCFEAY